MEKQNVLENLWYKAANIEYEQLRDEIEAERALLAENPNRVTALHRRNLEYLDAWLIRSRTELDRFNLPVDTNWKNVRHEAQTTWDKLKSEAREALRELRA
ncbi:MAG: hypothetical protein AAGU15_07225 [Anaerolineaceae bacterium]|jgi:hypothetical protein